MLIYLIIDAKLTMFTQSIENFPALSSGCGVEKRDESVTKWQRSSHSFAVTDAIAPMWEGEGINLGQIA